MSGRELKTCKGEERHLQRRKRENNGKRRKGEIYYRVKMKHIKKKIGGPGTVVVGEQCGVKGPEMQNRLDFVCI